MTGIAIAFSHISHHYGEVKALDDVSLAVQEGEFFSMLGPSGSGKTTSLRLMAGFEQPSQGALTLFGTSAVGTPPFARDVNTVFQDYALFPHMNVLDNVAYGLMVRRVDKAQRYKLAQEALALVALPDHGTRSPAQLSGGQRQRVALARALVNRPRVLLLDEPLGALDLKLREQMQVELKVLHRRLGITFVYVTHDQGEALSMSDRIAVFNHGRIEQIATPRELYHRPRTRFVADFVGSANVIDGELAQGLTGQRQAFAVRQEHVHLLHSKQASTGEGQRPILLQNQSMDSDAPTDMLQVQGEVLAVQFLGAQQRIEVRVGKHVITALQTQAQTAVGGPDSGDTVTLQWSRQHMVALAA